MESFPNITFNCNNKQMSNFIDIKRTSTFNYSSNIKIQLKKRSNSMLIHINKNNWLSIKYNFINTNKKFLESNIFDKLKSSLVKSDKKIPIMKKNNIFKKEDYDMNIKKIVTFDKKKIDCQNNRIIIIKDMSNKELFKRKPKKFNSFDSDELIIPLKSKNEYKKDDFEVLSLCGKGAYGTVLQVKLKSNVEQENKNKKDKEKEKEKFYAIKVIDKESMKKVNKFYQIYLESQILNELNSPFIVQIHGTFESKSKIYMVLDYLSNGNFATFLKMNYPLKEETIRFYAAEIVLFLEYLQSQKIVHRDLKPENIMLNEKYHLQIIDFATVRKIGYYYDKNEMKFRLDNYDLENDNEDIKGTKIIVNPDDDDDDEEEEEEEEEKDINLDNNIKNDNKHRIKRLPPRNKTFVGTAEYVSPEVIKDQTAEYGADLWAFGIILYEMFCGKTPFKGVNTFLTFKNIETLNITYEENISISENAKDLIKKILVKAEDRPTIAEVLQSPWVKENAPRASKKSLNVDWGHIQKYTKLNLVQKSIITFRAFHMTANEAKQYIEMFKIMDKNNDGVLTIDEIEKGIKHCKIETNMSNEAVVQLFKDMDIDKNGLVNYTEFVSALMDYEKEVKKEHIIECFKSYDADKSGKINFKEFCEIISPQNEKEKEELRELYNKFDENGDGEIDLNEFLDGYKKM